MALGQTFSPNAARRRGSMVLAPEPPGPKLGHLPRVRFPTYGAEILLPFYDVFDESPYFEPGAVVCVHPFRDFRLAITICEDVWNDKHFWTNRLYRRDPVEECVAAGANLLLNIASSPYNTEKIQLRYNMLRAIATKHAIAVAYVNHVGGNDQLLFDGSRMAHSKGASHPRGSRGFLWRIV